MKEKLALVIIALTLGSISVNLVRGDSGFSTSSASVVVNPTRFDGASERSMAGNANPPDIAVAAGPSHIMETVNRQIAIYNKQGVLLSAASLNSFFNLNSSDWTFDSRVVFDNMSRTWFATTAESTFGGIRVAVSNTADPTGGWHYYMIGGTQSRCYDQPRIGVSSDKVVITGEAYSYVTPSQPNAFCLGYPLADQYWVLNKSDMATGASHVHNITVTSLPFSYMSLQPMQALTPTSTIYLESTGTGALQNVQIVTINGAPPGHVTNSSTTIAPIAPFTSLPSQGAPTPDPNIYVSLGDNSRMQTVFWFQNKLWSAYSVGCTPPSDTTVRSCIQLLELNTTASPTIIQNFDYWINKEYLFYPALTLDARGSLYMIFGYSNSTTNPSLALTGQSLNDQATAMANFVTVAQSNTVGGIGGRYGDYFGAAADPSNSTLVWMAGEYTNPSDPSGGWGTKIASATFPTINLNRADSFEGFTFNTTGWLRYNPTSVTSGSLTVRVSSGTTTISTSTYSIRPQLAGNSAVRLVLFAHATDALGIELSAYLYLDVSTGTVTAYFGARNVDIYQHGIVDISDYSFITSRYNYCSGNPQYDPRADLVAAGCVNASSLSIVQSTYGFPVYR